MHTKWVATCTGPPEADATNPDLLARSAFGPRSILHSAVGGTDHRHLSATQHRALVALLSVIVAARLSSPITWT
jgi:hypothetical protein